MISASLTTPEKSDRSHQRTSGTGRWRDEERKLNKNKLKNNSKIKRRERTRTDKIRNELKKQKEHRASKATKNETKETDNERK